MFNVVMSLCRYFVMSLFRYPVIPLSRYPVIPIDLPPEVIVEDVVGIGALWCRTIHEEVVITGLRPVVVLLLTAIVHLVGIFLLRDALRLLQQRLCRDLHGLYLLFEEYLVVAIAVGGTQQTQVLFTDDEAPALVQQVCQTALDGM